MLLKFRNFRFQKNSLLLFILLMLFVVNIVAGAIVIKAELPRVLYYLHLTPKLTENEKELLSSLSRELSETEYQDTLHLALFESKETSSIEIGKCAIYPKVAYVQTNTYLRFTNSDSKIHVLSFTEDKKLRLEPGESKEILLDFMPNTPSVIGYGCDAGLTPAGALFVTE